MSSCPLHVRNVRNGDKASKMQPSPQGSQAREEDKSAGNRNCEGSVQSAGGPGVRKDLGPASTGTGSGSGAALQRRSRRAEFEGQLPGNQLKRAESGARRKMRGGGGVFPVERKASSKDQRLMSEGDDSSGLILNSSVVWLDLDAQESQSNRDAGARR